MIPSHIRERPDYVQDTGAIADMFRNLNIWLEGIGGPGNGISRFGPDALGKLNAAKRLIAEAEEDWAKWNE